ncbi:hypothetical protein CKAH01_07089 [Colletotrichum kahawae]|uniref:Uncharacterized protein n=1 Tax=Colletotrichum kahawae TaxID=34407 RepID=A0AAD9Y6W3_COLKA|nr:hypothetical protein CKAH01_07089 [Colletotrichum kahawae]
MTPSIILSEGPTITSTHFHESPKPGPFSAPPVSSAAEHLGVSLGVAVFLGGPVLPRPYRARDVVYRLHRDSIPVPPLYFSTGLAATIWAPLWAGFLVCQGGSKASLTGIGVEKRGRDGSPRSHSIRIFTVAMLGARMRFSDVSIISGCSVVFEADGVSQGPGLPLQGPDQTRRFILAQHCQRPPEHLSTWCARRMVRVAPGGGMAPRRGSFPTACPGVFFSPRLYETLAQERKSRRADSNPRRQERASGQDLGRPEPLHPPQSPPPASPHPSSYTKRGHLLYVVLDVQDSPEASSAKLSISLE